MISISNLKKTLKHMNKESIIKAKIPYDDKEAIGYFKGIAVATKFILDCIERSSEGGKR